MGEHETLAMLAVGDVFADVPDGGAALAPLVPLLALGDVVFGNCEGVYSDRPARSPSHKHFCGAALERGTMLGEAGFDVMTLANNHIVDGGYVGLADTMDLLHDQGIATVGAGVNLEEAMRPAIVEVRGRTIAFLGFCTVYPKGYEARANRPGLAPLRVRTHYSDPDENFWEPGIEPVVDTSVYPEDLRAYRAAITAAREAADLVVVANHWGYSSWVEVLQEYELDLARDAVDHGADVVVCHHHHSLRGVEVRDGRPIFYGLGTLLHHFHSIKVTPSELAAREARFGERSSWVVGEDLPLFPFRADARRTGVAIVDVGPDGSIAAGFVPAMIRADGTTEPLRAAHPEAREVADYLERLSAQSGFAASFTRGERDGWMYLAIR